MYCIQGDLGCILVKLGRVLLFFFGLIMDVSLYLWLLVDFQALKLRGFVQSFVLVVSPG